MGQHGSELRLSKLRRQPPRGLGKTSEWADHYLRDFGAFAMVVARHFGRKVWKVDQAIARVLDRHEIPRATQERWAAQEAHRKNRRGRPIKRPPRLEEDKALDRDDLDKLLSSEGTPPDKAPPTQDELDAIFGKGTT